MTILERNNTALRTLRYCQSTEQQDLKASDLLPASEEDGLEGQSRNDPLQEVSRADVLGLYSPT